MTDQLPASTAPLVLAAEFPPVDRAQWRAAVDKVLAGRDADLSEEELARRFARQLRTTTYDGITVEPLYSAGDQATAPTGAPGSWPFVRGASAVGGALDGWDVRQPVRLDEVPATGSAQALDQLEAGATSLLLRAGLGAPTVDTDLLAAALDGVSLELVSIALDRDLGVAGATALLGLWERRRSDRASVRGVLGLDPLGTAASSGVVDRAATAAAVELAVTCAEGWPGVRSLVADATRYHEAGASDTEELACAIATGVAYLRLLTDAGLDTDAAFAQLEFRLAATADQFSTIAKLRAARRLWARVAEVLGVPGAGAQRQHALTSGAMLSRYDPAVNLLRNTTACFAAGVGGAEAVTVEAHDGAVDPSAHSDLGTRMARNIQLLLIEESQLAQVVDPAGGSWYVEWLTDTMAERAWERFRQIETAGGMARALEDGSIRAAIEQTWAARTANLARRADTLVGVNDFPNPGEPMPPPPAAVPDPAPDPLPAGGMAPLPRRRYAEPFEHLRERADGHQRATGSRPAVLLVCLGTPADYTARFTFAKAFFETAGLHTAVQQVEAATSADELRAALADAGATLACLCSSDPVYAQHGTAEVLGALGAAGPVRTYVATRPGSLGDALAAEGADELIWAGCDVLDALTRALDVLEVS